MDEMEHRLRAVLTSRAASVEPSAADVGAIEARAALARRSMQRRRMVLSIAAVVLVVAAVAGGVLLTGDDDDRAEVATEGEATTTSLSTTTTSTTTTTTTVATTTSTLPPLTDDGVQGWPGNTSRMFDDPEAAALAFVTDELNFAVPTLGDSTVEGVDAMVVYHPRPTASVNTTLVLHDTGSARGWVVTGLTSNEGTIDAVDRVDNRTVTITGRASAFEATVSVFVLDVDGNVLGETFTMAGGSGELEPYEATITAERGDPFWVMICERDASADGDFVWAATAPFAA